MVEKSSSDVYMNSSRWWLRLAILAVLSTVPVTGICQNLPASSSSELPAKDVALSALKLLHDNRISKLYRDLVSDLQKSTGLTTEAKAVTAFSPTAQSLPGEPNERTLLFSRRSESLPVFFRNKKGDFYSFVFHSKYGSGEFNEEVYLVKESGVWKVAGLVVRPAL